MSIRNPWKDLPAVAPYVLPCDSSTVADYKQRYPGFIADDLLPQPFVGNPVAPVVLLLANPGVSVEDSQLEKDNAAFSTYLRSSVCDPVDGQHHAHLHEALASGPGYAWWIKRVGDLQTKCGPLSQKLLVLQRVPYHSKKYPGGLDNLPSFAYTEFLLKTAVARKALIICGRKRKSWEKVLGSDAWTMVHLKNPRAAFLTPRNMPDDAYRQLVEVLRR